MTCDIDNIRFGSNSKNTLEEIRQLEGMANALSTYIGICALVDIFAGNGVYMFSYKINTADFLSLTKQ